MMEPKPLTMKMEKVLLEGTELSHPAQSSGAKATIKKDWHLYQKEDVAAAVEYLKQQILNPLRYDPEELCLVLNDINRTFPCFAKEKMR